MLAQSNTSIKQINLSHNKCRVWHNHKHSKHHTQHRLIDLLVIWSAQNSFPTDRQWLWLVNTSDSAFQSDYQDIWSKYSFLWSLQFYPNRKSPSVARVSVWCRYKPLCQRHTHFVEKSVIVAVVDINSHTGDGSFRPNQEPTFQLLCWMYN